MDDTPGDAVVLLYNTNFRIDINAFADGRRR